MLLDVMAQIAAGLALGFFLLVAVVVLLLLAHSRRASERARSDRGPVTAVAGPADRASTPTPTQVEPARGGVDPGDVPPGARMTPLDGWDLLAFVLILAMALTAPPVGAVIAPLLVVVVLLDAVGRVWILLRHG
jgi:hypothetical protein